MTARQCIYLLFVTEIIASGFWYSGSALTAMLLIAAAVTSYCTMTRQQYWNRYALSKLMLVYLAWLFIVAWCSAVPEKAMMTLPMLAGLPVMYLFATNSPGVAQVWRYVLAGLFVTAVTLALWAIGQVYYQIGNGYAQGPFMDRNLFAALMNLLWFPAAYQFVNALNSRLKLVPLVMGVGLFIISTGLFATTSRGGIAAWLLLFPIMLWAGYQYCQSVRRMGLLVLIAAAAFLSSALLLNASIVDRTFDLGQDPSTTARLLLWKSSVHMIMAHPVIGSGWGTFLQYYPAYRVPHEVGSGGFFVHNDYLQLALEGGLPALLLQLAVLGGVVLALWRKRMTAINQTSFESIALLLGVLAIGMHAMVNFIFYQAVMNILAGLFLARAAHLTESARISVIASSNIPGYIRHFSVACLLAIIALPFAANLTGQAINNKQYIKKENLLAHDWNAYDTALWLARIQPQERVAQETILQSAEAALEDHKFMAQLGTDFYRQLLDTTLARFESVRKLNANDPALGVRQADLLIKHHGMFAAGEAYRKAHDILNVNLVANPYHVNSIVALSRLQQAEGDADLALQTLMYAKSYVLKQPSQALIEIEFLRQHANRQAQYALLPELDKMEKELHKILFHAETATKYTIAPDFYQKTENQLKEIAQTLL